ncbi:MAG: MFS transporter, partial [Deltaproteobacteria bacterium]|nr:MFS transporter [Deltaproteobacteria bacterium]
GPSVVADRAPAELRASYQGTYQMSWAIGAFVGPLAGGWLMGLGSGALWWVCALLGVVSALGQLALGPKLLNTGN